MNSDQGINALYLLLAMMLPLSALLVRRVPMRQSLLMIAAWIAIFLVAMLAIGLGRENGVGVGHCGGALRSFAAAMSLSPSR